MNFLSQDNTRAWCNKILRMDASRSNYNEVESSSNDRYENDHFFELQHVVHLLFTTEGTLTIGNIQEVRLGYWIDLATSVNRRENMYRIPGSLNQKKKKISWAGYAGDRRDPAIQEYLGKVTSGGRTVEQQVRELAVDMARRPSPWSFLTRQVGQQICAHMGWREGILTYEERQRAGDFDKKEWMESNRTRRARM
jgi:hypothetical protein